MNYTNYKLTLDMTKIESQVSIPVPQNDTARRLYIRLFHNGKQFTLPNGVRVVLAAQKADGTVIYNDCLIENHVIRYDFTEQTTSAAGEMKCQLRVYGRNGGLITSPKLTIVVYENIFMAENIVSSNEFTVLNQLIEEANGMIYEAEYGLKARIGVLETDVADLISAIMSALIIAAVTFIICFCGLFIGKKAGTKLACKAGILGGAILIFIGLEIFITSFF